MTPFHAIRRLAETDIEIFWQSIANPVAHFTDLANLGAWQSIANP